MRILLTGVLMFVLLGNVKAQRIFFVFGHVGYASPVGKLQNANKPGASVEIGGGVGIQQFFITATTGYTWLTANRNGTTKGGLRYAPVTAGIRKYILLHKIYLKADIGTASMKYVDTDNKSNHFTSSFGAGIKLTTFELQADYNSVASYGSWFGLKAGFNLGL